MRTYNDSFMAKLMSESTSPIQLCIIKNTGGSDIYASDREISIDGQSFEALVENWGTLEVTESGVGSMSVNFWDGDQILTGRLPWFIESVEVYLYQTFDGLALDQKELIDIFVMRDPFEKSEKSSTVSIDLVSLHEKYRNPIGITLTKSDWPHIPDGIENTSLPILAGSSTVDAVLLTEPPRTSLVGSHILGSTTLYVESTEGFSDSGTLQVEDLDIIYSSKTSNSFVCNQTTRDFLDSVEVSGKMEKYYYGLCTGSAISFSSLKGDDIDIVDLPVLKEINGVSVLESDDLLTVTSFDTSSKFVSIHPDTILGINQAETGTGYDPADYSAQAGSTTATNAGYAFDDENETYAAVMRTGDILQLARLGDVNPLGDILRVYARFEVFSAGQSENAYVEAKLGANILGRLNLMDKGGSGSTVVSVDLTHEHTSDVTREHTHQISVNVNDTGHSHGQTIDPSGLEYRSMFATGSNAFGDGGTTTGYPIGFGSNNTRPTSGSANWDSLNVGLQSPITVFGHTFSGMTVDDYNANRPVQQFGIIVWAEFEHYLDSGGSLTYPKYEATLDFDFSVVMGGYTNLYQDAKAWIYKDDDTSESNRELDPKVGTLIRETSTRVRIETSLANAGNVPLQTLLDAAYIKGSLYRTNTLGRVYAKINACQLVLSYAPASVVTQTDTSMTNIVTTSTGAVIDPTLVDVSQFSEAVESDIEITETTNTAITNFDITGTYSEWNSVTNLSMLLTYSNPNPNPGTLYVLNAGFEFEFKPENIMTPTVLSAIVSSPALTPSSLRLAYLTSSGVPPEDIIDLGTVSTSLNGSLEGSLSAREADIILNNHTPEIPFWEVGKAVMLQPDYNLQVADLVDKDFLQKSISITRREMSNVIPIQNCKLNDGSIIPVSDPDIISAVGSRTDEVDYPLFSDDQFMGDMKLSLLAANMPASIVETDMFLEAMRFQVGDLLSVEHKFIPGVSKLRVLETSRTFGSGKIRRINTVKIKAQLEAQFFVAIYDSSITIATNAITGTIIPINFQEASGSPPYNLTLTDGDGPVWAISGLEIILLDTNLFLDGTYDLDLTLEDLTTGKITTATITVVGKNPTNVPPVERFESTWYDDMVLTWVQSDSRTDFADWQIRRDTSGVWDTASVVASTTEKQLSVAGSRGDVFMIRESDTVGNLSVTRYIRTGLGDNYSAMSATSPHIVDYVAGGFPGTKSNFVIDGGTLVQASDGLFLGPSNDIFMGTDSDKFFDGVGLEASYEFDYAATTSQIGKNVEFTISVSSKSVPVYDFQLFDGENWVAQSLILQITYGGLYKLRIHIDPDADSVTLSELTATYDAPLLFTDFGPIDISSGGYTLSDNYDSLLGVDLILNDIGTGAVSVNRDGYSITAVNTEVVPVAASVTGRTFGIKL